MHFKENEIKDDSLRINKKLYLEFKNVDGCEICGYNKCDDAICFHHERDKKFILSQVKMRFKSIEELKDEIIEELNKCIVLCANCHFEKHNNKERFEKLKEKIYEKIKTYIEVPKNLDKDLIKKLYYEGKTQTEITKIMNCAKSTVSETIKKLKQKGEIQ